MMMAWIQIFKNAFTTCKKKKKKAEKYPFFLHRMPLEEFPIAVFFLLSKKSPKVDTQSLFW